LVAISPLGKLSGAHINPAVSLAFWVDGKMNPHDLIGYIAGQLLGAILGEALLVLVWGNYARSVMDGMTLPGSAYPLWVVFLAEMSLTGVLVLAIFICLSSQRLMHWTPLVTWLLIATMVWLESPVSGTSLNPARSLAPALFATMLSYRCDEPMADAALPGSSGWIRRHQWATASTNWRISSRVSSSRKLICSSKSLEACGTSTCGSGTTTAPMRLSTPRRAACAFAEPDLPSTAPITATGLLRRILGPDGREAQSIALASTPGTAPLYSGVAIRMALALRIACLKWWTAPDHRRPRDPG
jgi:hypothetical protein